MENNLLRYKYLPFDEGSLSVLSKGTMKFTSPINFNDPFDCVPEFDHKKFAKYIDTRKDLRKMAGDAIGLSPAQRIQNKRKMMKLVENTAKSTGYGNALTSNLGICALSRNPLNLLMWAHYAKDHTGFVVEFSIPNFTVTTQKEVTDYLLKWLFPLKVRYSTEKPIINPFDDHIENMEKNFLVKSIDWKYEQEERVIDHIRGSGIHPYDRKRVLKSIIAGMRINDDDYNQLETVIDALNQELNISVTLHRAEPVQGEFSLYVPGRNDLSSRSET